MPADSTATALARVEARLDGFERELERISGRLDQYASGEVKKIQGAAELAARVDQVHLLVGYLDNLLVRGDANNPSMKSVVEALRTDLSEVKEAFRDVKTKLEKQAQIDASVRVAEIASRSQNWKTTAVMVASIIASLTALGVVLWS